MTGAGSVIETALEHATAVFADDAVRASARRHLVDTVGCVIGARAGSMAAVICEAHHYLEVSDGVAVTGLGGSFPLGQAVTFETALAHVDEFDGFHAATAICPIGVAAVPALLMAAQAGEPGRAVLDGLVVGAEALLAVATMLGSSAMYERSFWPSSVLGAIGAAAATASVLRLTDEQRCNALAIAAVQGGGMMSVTNRAEGHYLLYGRAASSGLEAAVLAAGGARGDVTVLDSVGPNALGVRGGVRPAGPLLPEVAVKALPVALPLHAACEALVDAVAMLDGGVGAIRRVEVHIPSATHAIVNLLPTPRSSDEAVCSLPYVLAAALDGVADQPSTYRPAALTDRGRAPSFEISLSSDPDLDAAFPEHWSATVVVHPEGGPSVRRTVTDAVGSPARPLDDVRLHDKFLSQAGPVLGESVARECLERLLHIDDLHDLRPLRELLTTGPLRRSSNHPSDQSRGDST